MKSIMTIARRELLGYFHTPIGYIFLAAFLLFTNLVALFGVTRFFEYPVADMRPYFHVFAMIGAFLVSAITMRLWSEEREANTCEMLLTLPMRTRHLVLGKFVASLIFYVGSLVCTMTVPLMMVLLSRQEDRVAFGLLDIQAVMSGYLGALLVGCLFISFGLFISGLCRDQVVAFVLTAPVLFVCFVVGIPDLRMAMDDALQFAGRDLGHFLADFVGIYIHFDNMVRGRLQITDILFFVSWTVIFLTLNGFGIERRGRPKANLIHACSIVILVLIGFAVNWILLGVDLGWVDTTQDKLHTISDVSVSILKRVKTPVKVRYVVTPKGKLPNRLRNLERDVRDKLDALREASGNMIEYQIVHMSAEQGIAGSGDGNSESVEKKVLRRIEPFEIMVKDDGKNTTQKIYSNMQITYKEHADETFPVMPFSPRAVGISELEFFIVRYVDRVTKPKVPVIAMVAPLDPVDPQLENRLKMQGKAPPPPYDPWGEIEDYLRNYERYIVQRVSLSRDEPLPEEYDLLAVIAPRELNRRQQYEINRALVEGKPVLIAVQNQVFDYANTPAGFRFRMRSMNPNINPVLPTGIAADAALLMTPDPVAVAFPLRTDDPRPMAARYPALAMHSVLSGDCINASHRATSAITNLEFIWSSTLSIDEAALNSSGFKVTQLLQSQSGAWVRSVVADHLTRSILERPLPWNSKKRFPLAAMLEGQFKMQMKERPDWPSQQETEENSSRKEVSESPIVERTGKLALFANARQFHRDANGGIGKIVGIRLFLDSIASLVLDEDSWKLRELRDRQYRDRSIGSLGSAQRRWWKGIQLFSHAFLVIVTGIMVWLYRRRRREAYERRL